MASQLTLTLNQIHDPQMSLINTQKPETFLLSQEQQDKLPPASREALEQVDQCTFVLPHLHMLNVDSKVFSCNRAIKLATGPDNTALPTTNRRIRQLRALVSHFFSSRSVGADCAGIIYFISQEPILYGP